MVGRKHQQLGGFETDVRHPQLSGVLNARQLEGQQFKTFDDLREAVWKAIGADPKLRADFGPSNIALMQQGMAPVAQSAQHYGAHSRYVLHHALPIQHGGAVYDFSNLLIVTPLRHQTILPTSYHFGKG